MTGVVLRATKGTKGHEKEASCRIAGGSYAIKALRAGRMFFGGGKT